MGTGAPTRISNNHLDTRRYGRYHLTGQEAHYYEASDARQRHTSYCAKRIDRFPRACVGRQTPPPGYTPQLRDSVGWATSNLRGAKIHRPDGTHRASEAHDTKPSRARVDSPYCHGIRSTDRSPCGSSPRVPKVRHRMLAEESSGGRHAAANDHPPPLPPPRRLRRRHAAPARSHDAGSQQARTVAPQAPHPACRRKEYHEVTCAHAKNQGPAWRMPGRSSLVLNPQKNSSFRPRPRRMKKSRSAVRSRSLGFTSLRSR